MSISLYYLYFKGYKNWEAPPFDWKASNHVKRIFCFKIFSGNVKKYNTLILIMGHQPVLGFKAKFLISEKKVNDIYIEFVQRREIPVNICTNKKVVRMQYRDTFSTKM